MSLTDLMSNSGLAIYAEVAMILFLVAFVAIAIRIFAPSRRAEMEAAGRLPFDDHDAASGRPGARP